MARGGTNTVADRGARGGRDRVATRRPFDISHSLHAPHPPVTPPPLPPPHRLDTARPGGQGAIPIGLPRADVKLSPDGEITLKVPHFHRSEARSLVEVPSRAAPPLLTPRTVVPLLVRSEGTRQGLRLGFRHQHQARAFVLTPRSVVPLVVRSEVRGAPLSRRLRSACIPWSHAAQWFQSACPLRRAPSSRHPCIEPARGRPPAYGAGCNTPSWSCPLLYEPVCKRRRSRLHAVEEGCSVFGAARRILPSQV